MNILALILFLIIGFFINWGDAFFAIGGYLFAFLIAGWMKSRGEF